MNNQLKRISIKHCIAGVSIVLTLLITAQPALVLADANPSDTTTPTVSTATEPSSAPATSSDTTTATTPPCTPPTNGTGVIKPSGADTSTYTYNCISGLWENQYYTWNPTTHQTNPKTPLVYVYNSGTKLWDVAQWVWSAAKNAYVQTTTSVTTPPVGAQTSGGPQPISDTSNNTSPNVTSPSQSNSGVDSSTTNNNNNLNATNTITAGTLTGDATVATNTTGGSAGSGMAQTVANIMNLLQSSASLAGPNATTFVSNINGDVQGDLLIDPSALQPAVSGNGLSDNTKINNVTNGQINNDITLNSQSGNANVAKNTSAGDATSGSADAVANVVNLVNSAIAASQSFLGVVNIYGNLNGNILVPSQLLNSLVASNVPRATLDTSNITNSNILNQFNNANINNTVDATAKTGLATVSDNTSAGNATSGNASTNVTLFNLTGQQVVGDNSMLVFVNVLGKWVGLIMNAPAGTTAAELGGGITQDNQLANTDINSATNTAINNNINVVSQSGDASIYHNTTAGNATSGNASASVNLLNIANSQMSFSNWFGILFINVFGTWTGNFGTYDPTATPSNAPLSTGNSVPTNHSNLQVFRFAPSSHHEMQLVSYTGPASGNNQVLGSSTKGGATIHASNVSNQGVHTDRIMYLPVAASVFILTLLASYEIRRKHKSFATV